MGDAAVFHESQDQRQSRKTHFRSPLIFRRADKLLTRGFLHSLQEVRS